SCSSSSSPSMPKPSWNTFASSSSSSSVLSLNAGASSKISTKPSSSSSSSSMISSSASFLDDFFFFFGVIEISSSIWSTGYQRFNPQTFEPSAKKRPSRFKSV